MTTPLKPLGDASYEILEILQQEQIKEETFQEESRKALMAKCLSRPHRTRISMKVHRSKDRLRLLDACTNVMLGIYEPVGQAISDPTAWLDRFCNDPEFVSAPYDRFV